ncbi:PP2C family protein-serine/threonine phosphatase [Nonomuraea cavernae]|uniref:PP2C family protein-serine/threonine phosphatase n=1 Tax=Nonomuraea cavernae TaxID=2045107 RepID=UPI0033F709C1
MWETGGPSRWRPLMSPANFAVLLVVVTGVVVGLDLITASAAWLVPLLVFLPAIVSGLGTVGQTAFASVWVALVVAASVTYLGGDLLGNLLATGFSALFGLFSVLGCRYRTRRDEEIRRLRSAASALQRQILRPLPLRTADVVVDGVYRPVEEDAMIGGDMYEVAASEYGTRVLIADVQGKGLTAIGTAFVVLGAFREAAHREPTLLGVVDALESAVARQNTSVARTGEPERFVTALVLGIGPGRWAEVVDCGHMAPYLIHDGHAGQVDIGEPGPPLGLAELSPEPRRVARFAFPARATVLLCTDGVTEARDRAGAFYPLEERLRSWARDPPARLAQTLSADLSDFTKSPTRDDLAILTIRRRGAARRAVQ